MKRVKGAENDKLARALGTLAPNLARNRVLTLKPQVRVGQLGLLWLSGGVSLYVARFIG